MDARSYESSSAKPSRLHEGFAALPANAVNWIAVWRRNYLVWRKLAVASMFGNLADPMIYLFGLGLGLGLMVGHVDGVSYIAFLAAGTVASSVMMSASFESMYSGFSRMHVQRTWEAIMHTPLTLGDIVLGEVIWAASKSVLSGAAIMLVAGVLCSFSGAYLTLVQSGFFLRDMSAGAGYLALTALVFGNWRPLHTVLGCLMFGLFGAIQIQLEGVDLPVVGRLPGSLIQAIPYIVTVVVLAGLMAKSVAPKAIGKPFVKSR